MLFRTPVERALENLRRQVHAPLRLVLWDGREVRLSEDPVVTLRLKDPGIAASLRHPSLLSLAEAYIEGRAELEGDVHEAVRSATAIARSGDARAFGGRDGARHGRDDDREAVQRHYDVSNAFYALWLDPRMVYSCAYFRDPAESLEAAQENKLDHICRKLRLAPGERFLDIGCGWGALAIHAALRYGVHATGITLSANQHRLATERVRELGLESRCRILLEDYRDHAGEGAYDKVASVGMFEHVGLANLPVYFGVVRRLLREGGIFLNHGITSSDPDNRIVGLGGGEFIARYVFPRGELPHLHRVVRDMAAADFEVHDVECLRAHYALTLRHWSDRYERRWHEAVAAAGERTARIWRLYLAGCAHAFGQRWVSIHQVLAVRAAEAGPSRLPLTRDWMYPPQ